MAEVPDFGMVSTLGSKISGDIADTRQLTKENIFINLLQKVSSAHFIPIILDAVSCNRSVQCTRSGRGYIYRAWAAVAITGNAAQVGSRCTLPPMTKAHALCIFVIWLRNLVLILIDALQHQTCRPSTTTMMDEPPVMLAITTESRCPMDAYFIPGYTA